MSSQANEQTNRIGISQIGWVRFSPEITAGFITKKWAGYISLLRRHRVFGYGMTRMAGGGPMTRFSLHTNTITTSERLAVF